MILLYERIKNKRVKTYERVNDILCKESRHILDYKVDLYPSFFLWKIDPRGRRWSKPGPSLKILSQLTILAHLGCEQDPIESRFAIRAMMMTSFAAILNEMYRRTITGCGILGSLSSATRRLQKYRSPALLPVLIALLLKTEQRAHARRASSASYDAGHALSILLYHSAPHARESIARGARRGQFVTWSCSPNAARCAWILHEEPVLCAARERCVCRQVCKLLP